jgi:hypothetical protein
MDQPQSAVAFFGDRPKKETFETASSMCTQDEQVCGQLLGQLHDFFRRVALPHDDLDGLSCVSE